MENDGKIVCCQRCWKVKENSQIDKNGYTYNPFPSKVLVTPPNNFPFAWQSAFSNRRNAHKKSWLRNLSFGLDEQKKHKECRKWEIKFNLSC